jgi:mRNA interferase RelE/StbE
MGQIVYASGALRALRRMPANEARKIRSKIEQYADDPASLANNVKRLKGRPGYRLRIGDWRVIFDRNGRDLTILAIGARGGIYEQ